jgi:single-stranded-DNA-specific exonuclease
MRLDKRNICLLEEGFEALASKVLSDEDLVPVIDVDAELRLESIGDDLIHQLNRLAPFGEQNKEPVFAASSVEVLESGVVGDRHLKMKVGQGSALQEAIGFRMGFMKPMEGSRVDLLFTPEYNRWRGRDRIQLRLVDLRPSGSPGISP